MHERERGRKQKEVRDEKQLTCKQVSGPVPHRIHVSQDPTDSIKALAAYLTFSQRSNLGEGMNSQRLLHLLFCAQAVLPSNHSR